MATVRQGSSGGWSPATVQETSTGGGHRGESRDVQPRPAGAAAPSPRFGLAQLVLLQVAAAAVLCGLAARHGWQVAGIAVAALLILVSVVRVQRRFTGLESLAWPYQVVDVASSGGTPIAVIRGGTTWALPLELRQDSVFNDDAGVPLGGLTSLLKIEDVSMASVRLLSLVTPAVVPAGAPAGPTPLLARGASRHCILTLDTMLAAGALADRGGSDAAIMQILRRCAMRAQEVLGTGRVSLHTLDEAAVQRLLDSCLGPPGRLARPADAATAESATGIRIGGTYSTTVVVSGPASTALGRLTDLLPHLPGRVAATALVLMPDRRRGGARSTLLVRVSAPADRSTGNPGTRLRKMLSRAGLPVQRVDGEQAGLLRASTPLGLTEGTV